MKREYINTLVPNISIHVYSYISISVYSCVKNYANRNIYGYINYTSTSKIFNSRFPIESHANQTRHVREGEK